MKAALEPLYYQFGDYVRLCDETGLFRHMCLHGLLKEDNGRFGWFAITEKGKRVYAGKEDF